MPALATVVTNYLTAVKDALKQGTDLGSSVRGAAQNYLRAQDMATVLDLLQQALSQSSALTTVSGTTTSVTDGAATFDVDSQIGNVVVFAGNTTAALAGVERRVVANDATTLTFSSYDPLPAAPAAGDEYTIRGEMFQDYIDDLREEKSLADSPAGSVYGHNRVAVAALVRGIELLGGTLSKISMGTMDTGTGSTESVLVVDNRGAGDMRIDGLRGLEATVSGETRIIVANDETTLTLSSDLSSAPSSGTAVALTVPVTDFGGTAAQKMRVHPGAQPGENRVLADLVDQLQTVVAGFTLPT